MRAFFLAFFVTLSGIVAWNTWADANACLRGVRLDAWPDGQVLSVAQPAAYRPLKRALARAAERPDILVLGNSHLFGARQERLGGKKLLNLCVPGGDLEDIADFWGLMKGQGKIPHVVLMPMEPSYINGLGDKFFRAFQRPDGARFIVDSALPLRDKAVLLGWELKHSVKGFFDAVIGAAAMPARWGQRNFQFMPLAQVMELPQGQGFKRDGSEIKKDIVEGHADEALFLAREKAALYQGHGGLEPWHLSARRQRLWRALLTDMRAQGCEVWVLSTPMHPSAKARFAKFADIYAETGAWMKELRGEGLIQKLSVDHGSELGGCKDQEFYDGTHPSSPCMDRILQQWAAVPAKPSKLR